MAIPPLEFKILLYGPNLHPAGVRGRAHFDGDALVITVHASHARIPADQITLMTGGYDGRQWLISWMTPEGTFSAMLQGGQALEAFIQLAPGELAKQLTHKRRKLSRKSRLALVGIGLLALCALLLVAWIWANADRLGQWVISPISIQQEQRLGELAYTQLRPSLKLQENGAAPRAVKAIGEYLTRESLYTYHFHVAIAPEINAFALPGGHIVVNTGLLAAADSAEEVAGVLAHEISHVEQRHTLRNLVLALGWRAFLGIVLGDYSASHWGNLAAHLGSLSYSRKLEIEADREGLEILQRANISPHGMETFFQKLAQRQDALPALLSSHPADEDRLATLRAAIARVPADDLRPLAIDWQRVKFDL